VQNDKLTTLFFLGIYEVTNLLDLVNYGWEIIMVEDELHITGWGISLNGHNDPPSYVSLVLIIISLCLLCLGIVHYVFL